MLSALIEKLSFLCATICGVGRSSFAPGTVATLVALLPFIFYQPSYKTLSIMIICSFIIGVISSSLYSKLIKIKDPGKVVIDELCGVWIAIWVGYFISKINSSNNNLMLINRLDNVRSTCLMKKVIFHNSIYLILAFLSFRLFDILKPFPISLIDRKISGGIGIMLDDVVAGLMAGGLVYLIGILL